MSLTLGNRQLAMLREMGVRVWQPSRPGKADAVTLAPVLDVQAPQAAVVDAMNSAINTGAARARIQSDSGRYDAKKPALNTASASLPRAELAQPAQTGSAWQIGELQTLYSPSAALTNVPRWLVLLEAPAVALQSPFNPFEGDAGKLLDNMLRATGMHTAGAVQLVPLVRGDGVEAAGRSGSPMDLPGQLAQLLAHSQPDVVLVMGRLAAQALLQSTEPLTKLRGQVHTVHNARVIISLEPVYLLRNPLEKAKAWDDLCLAMSVAGVAG